MDRNRSATELKTILLEPNGHGGTYVWLRKNIQQIEETDESGLSQTMWEADEVSGLLPYTLTMADAETYFDEIWEQLESSAPDIASLKRKLDAVSDTAEGAAKVAGLTADGLAELAGLVSDLLDGGGING